MRRVRTILATLAALLAGCSSTPFVQPEQLRSALSKDSVVLDVPKVEDHEPGECGFACLTSLLRYHHLDLDAEARSRFPKEAKEESSIAAGDIRDYLRRRGLRAHLVHGTLDARPPCGLYSVLQKKLPALVSLHVKGQDHYVLVCGYDGEKRLVFIMDPAKGVGGVPADDFEGYWAPNDHLMLVAAPRPAPQAAAVR